MLAPVSAKQVRRAFKALKRRAPCPRAELLRSLILEADPSVPILRPSPVDHARSVLINAGRAYCLAKCGGCALTDGLKPPA